MRSTSRNPREIREIRVPLTAKEIREDPRPVNPREIREIRVPLTAREIREIRVP